MQYNGSQRPAFGSLFSRVCLLLLCSQLSDMQCPWVHSFTADSSSWLLGLKLRCRPSQMLTFMSLDVYSRTARPHSSSSRLTNLHLTTVWKSLLPSCPREHLLLFYWWQLFRLESDGISLSFWLYFLKAWLHWVLFYIFIAYLWSTYLDHLPNFQSRLPSFHLSALATIPGRLARARSLPSCRQSPFPHHTLFSPILQAVSTPSPHPFSWAQFICHVSLLMLLELI